MRKLIIVAVIGYLVYAYNQGTLSLPFFQADNTPVISNDNPGGVITISNNTDFSSSRVDSTRPTIQSPAHSQHRCDGRQHCSQMGSYEEAVFFIRNCPNTKMDGDHDGIPCESQFGRR